MISWLLSILREAVRRRYIRQGKHRYLNPKKELWF